MKKLKIKDLTFIAALAALSAVVQLFHIGYQSPQWGMWIDLVAVSWLAAFLMFGLNQSLTVTLVGSLIITLFAPETWLGAVMKATATLPIILILFLWDLVFQRNKPGPYKSPLALLPPTIAGVILRSLIIIPVNYYFAIPIWTGMSAEQAIKSIPWQVIAGFNAVQSLIDVYLAWLIIYKFGLKKYSEEANR